MHNIILLENYFLKQILGDPDYLMPSSSGPVKLITQQFYGDDFAINPNSGQVFIEVDFKQVEDYNATYNESGAQEYSENGRIGSNNWRTASTEHP